MGAFSKREDIIISRKPGWEDHEYVKIKGVLTIGDQQAVVSGWMDGNSKKDSKVNLTNDRVALLRRMIVEWNLTGDNGPVPLSKETIAELPAEYSDPILEAIDEVTKRGQLSDPLTSSNGVAKLTSVK